MMSPRVYRVRRGSEPELLPAWFLSTTCRVEPFSAIVMKASALPEERWLRILPVGVHVASSAAEPIFSQYSRT